MSLVSFLKKTMLIVLLLFAPLAANECLSECFWYASMGGGVNFRDQARMGNGSKSFLAGPLMDVALGWQFSRYFSSELAYAFRTQPLGKVTDSTPGNPLTAEESSQSIMVNGYFSLDPICGFRPYAGWGLGYGDVLYSEHTNELPAPSMTHTKHHAKGVAYQCIGGFAYAWTSHIDLGVEYRLHGITNLKYINRGRTLNLPIVKTRGF